MTRPSDAAVGEDCRDARGALTGSPAPLGTDEQHTSRETPARDRDAADSLRQTRGNHARLRRVLVTPASPTNTASSTRTLRREQAVRACRLDDPMLRPASQDVPASR